MLELHLKNWGLNVVSAADGEEALAILESDDPPQVAILDWMMPKMDGLEVCARVREHPNRPYVYLVVMTAKSLSEDMTEGFQAGADDYMIKPFEPAELRARLSVGQRVIGLERVLADKVTKLEATLADVKKLKGLLPICMYCKSVRDDRDYWHTIEEYIYQETGTDFSHGVCPACLAKLQAGEPVGR